MQHSINGVFSIREGPWKLILGPGSGGWGQPDDAAARKNGRPEAQLYNLTTDPGETLNVEAKNPAIVARLNALLTRYVNDGRSTPGPKGANDVGVSILKTSPR